MGTNVSVARKKNLYDFWKVKITAKINQELDQNDHKLLINLASNEYFSAIDTKKTKSPDNYAIIQRKQSWKVPNGVFFCEAGTRINESVYHSE
jgi:hypothetical protein